MWMIWKARNDLLFNAKRWSLSQVLCAANALLTVGNDEQKILAASKQSHVPSVPMPHPTQPVFSLPAGPIAYCDAAFNPIMDTRTAGLGVYLHNPDRNAKIFIQAVSCMASSVLQAEAHALLLAVRVVYMRWDGLEFLSSLTTKCLLTQPQQMIYSQLQATGRSDQSLLMCSIAGIRAGISLLKELSKFLAPRTRWLMRLLSAPFGIIQIPAVCSDVNQTCCLLRFVYAGLLFVISVIPLGGCWQFTARRVK
jgi:hypothetical protein